MPRRNWPRYRADRDCWVSNVNGRQVILGRDFDSALKELKRILRQHGRKLIPEGTKLPRRKPVPGQSRPCDEEWRQVYFIRNTVNGCIKIGQTKDVKKRLKALQLANAEPLELMGFMMAKAVWEQHLHLKFARFRIHGEWFRGEPELIAAVEELLAVYGR